MNNELFFHGKTKDNRRFTICALVNGGGLRISAAICSAKDNFSRKIGRNISKGRLAKSKHILDVWLDDIKEPIKTLVKEGTGLNSKTSDEFLEIFDL
jgi:hypothetical protein